MSEEAKEAPAKKKKKGSKLPMIVVLVVLLGGGYFMMGKKGGKEKKKEEIKMAHEAVPFPKEFIVNLQGGANYLRCEIALGTKEGLDKHAVEAQFPAFQDAIIEVLSSKSASDLRTSDGKRLAKVEIADKLNQIMAHLEEGAAEEEESKDEKKKGEDKEGKKEGEHGKGHGSEKVSMPENEHGWDHDKGPILKIYFTSFATQ